MKRQVSSGYVFTPGSAALDLSNLSGITAGGLLAVINRTAGNQLIYAAGGGAGLGGTFAGLVLTLQAPMTGMAASDALIVIYDDGTLAGGSTGLDFSANQPVLPGVGAAFGASGPYANYVLVRTVPASASRAFVEIDNNSPGPVVVMRDDGTAAAGAAPVRASVFPLAAAAAAGQQGGAWSSTTFKGRLQIYAPAGTSPQIATFTD